MRQNPHEVRGHPSLLPAGSGSTRDQNITSIRRVNAYHPLAAVTGCQPSLCAFWYNPFHCTTACRPLIQNFTKTLCALTSACGIYKEVCVGRAGAVRPWVTWEPIVKMPVDILPTLSPRHAGVTYARQNKGKTTMSGARHERSAPGHLAHRRKARRIQCDSGYVPEPRYGGKPQKSSTGGRLMYCSRLTESRCRSPKHAEDATLR